MKRTLNRMKSRLQRGSVAVEAALVFSFLAAFFLMPSIFMSFYFFEYSTAQKAVHDAGLYLATAPKLEMTTVGPDGGPAALTLAKTIIAREMVGLSSGGIPIDPSIVCAYQQTPTSVAWKQCTTTNNQPLIQLAVSVDMNFVDPLTGSDSGWVISAYAPVRYVGN
ncbi:TadE/TadG family type IV pilus assembly protein [Massilia terrae]|uniref:Pilus assembly protein n=1 Tax=Massilia terrae TaxID=1811224 RepID=A0ABT2CWG8_9BURK|nr:TadE family protein [Massilia terrae]MCS0658332.1 pilus assembly protein [Massilia terrae]